MVEFRNSVYLRRWMMTFNFLQWPDIEIYYIKMKFFQAEAISLQLYDETLGIKANWELYNNAACSFVQIP